jgi:isopropylmalate/homocitrate/citramalate synthase
LSTGKDIYVSPYNFIKEVVGEVRLPEKVGLYDCTLRDGEQVPGLVFRKDEKIRIARALDDLGVQRIEVGMPVASPEDREVAKELVKMGLQAELWGFARCVKGDVDACIECDLSSIICEIAVSDLKMKAYGFTKERVLQSVINTITYAKEHGLRVAFFNVDMTRTSLDFLKEVNVAAVKEAHADEVVAVDTLGVATPEAFYYLVKKLKEWVNVPIHVHCHNEFGLATALSIAGVKAGAEWIHVTVNGIGERSGNTDLAEVAMALYLLYGKDIGIRYEKLCEISRLVQELSGIKMPPNKPVVGDCVFKRESGVAVLQLLNYPPSVEPYPPELVGGKREIVLGKKSGTHAVEWKLREMGFSATKEQVAAILERVKAYSIKKKGPLTDDEFAEIAKEVIKG